ncbi:Transposase, IS4-like [Aromatoleum bremense]|nr:Transposase, IS4-like [Aromatoleum bremense]
MWPSMTENALHLDYSFRGMFALRWLARAGAPWQLLLTNDFPPWQMVYQQFRRWNEAGCFEAMVSDMRSIIRVSDGRPGQPSAVILDGRTLQSSCESGPRAGYDGYKRRRGSKVHMAVDTLGQLVALTVTPANEQERAQVKDLCEAVQQATGETVKVAWADQGYTGDEARKAAQAAGIDLQIVKLPEAKKGFVLLPRRWSSSAVSGAVPIQTTEPGFRADAASVGPIAFRRLLHPHAAQGRVLAGLEASS